MIDPPPAVAMCRAACVVPASTPSTFTPITWLKSARSSSRKLRCIVPETPALLTITCSPPNECRVNSTSPRTSSGSATSTAWKTADGPSDSTSSLPGSAFRSAMTTRAPSATNRWAIPRPRPLAPPVTIATRPSSSFTFTCRLSPGDRQAIYPVRDAVVLELDLVDGDGQAQGGDPAEERAVHHLQLD